MKFDIITFGSAVVDVFVDTDVAEKNKKISYPVGSKILINELREDIGGGGTNTAVAFSRFGLKTGFIGKIGKDNSGKSIINMLEKEKITFLGKAERHEKTGYSIILDSREHNRTILTYKAINNNISWKDIKKHLRDIKKKKYIYFTSLLGESFKTQIKLSRIAKTNSIKIIFNPSDYLIRHANKNKLYEVLKNTHILIFNKQEAEMLCRKYHMKIPKKNPELVRVVSELGPNIIVITDKNNKIWAYDKQNNKTAGLKPHKIKVKERTGAGDAFGAGFAAGIITGKGIEKSLELGLKESESVLRYFGAKNKLLEKKLKKP